jgi:hypothetical protein
VDVTVVTASGTSARFAADTFNYVAPAWQNPVNALDVDADGSVFPLDALIVINALNTEGAHTLTASDVTPPYVDVNGDGFLAPLDALLVINYLNSQSASSQAVFAAGQFSVSPAGSAPSTSAAVLASVEPLSIAADDQELRGRSTLASPSPQFAAQAARSTPVLDPTLAAKSDNLEDLLALLASDQASRIGH